MGLSIKKYKRSYSCLHILREAALRVDGNYTSINNFYFSNDKTKFREFIVHCDCEGGYISKKSKQYNKYCNKWSKEELQLGDLDKLKEEVIYLNNHIKKYLDEWDGKAWDDFYDDVMSSRMILEFH